MIHSVRFYIYFYTQIITGAEKAQYQWHDFNPEYQLLPLSFGRNVEVWLRNKSLRVYVRPSSPVPLVFEVESKSSIVTLVRMSGSEDVICLRLVYDC
jgi:hypothetical protein